MRWKIVVFILLCLTIACTLVHSPMQSGLCSQTIQKDHKNHKKVKPKALNGVINFTDWDFQEDGSVKLNGEWELYWNQLLSPNDFTMDKPNKRTGFVHVPSVWNDYQIKDESFTGHGYATYRLKIKLKKGRAYAVKLSIMSTAYQVWVDKEFLSVGKVGNSRENMTPQFAVKTIRFVPETSETQIVLQISNFYHRSGGPWRALTIGFDKQIAEKQIKFFAFDIFLIGAILIMGIYHLSLFVLRRKDITTLYFGAICFAAVVRTLVTGEHVFYFLFPDFNWFIIYKFEYLSFYLGISLSLLFINSLYPDESLDKTSIISLSLAIVFSLIVLITPPQVFSHTVQAYQVIAMVSFLYIVFVIFRAVMHKQPGSLFVAIGSVMMLLIMINDVLYANVMISSFYMVPLGLLLFIILHSINLSLRFSNAFTKIEIIEEQYRSVFENSLDGISQISFSEKTFIANPALLQMLGYSSFEDTPKFLKDDWQQIFVDSEIGDQCLNEIKLNHKVSEFEAEFYRKDGTIIWVSINARASRDKNNNILIIDSIIHDISHEKEKERLEAKMLEVQKMEAMGHLAGGIAHDFNNIISAISGNVQLLIMGKEEPLIKKEKQFRNIIGACDRATSLINQILTFSRKNKQESFKAIKLDSIIKEVTRFIRSTIPASIEIEQEIDSQSSIVLSNSTQIYQIIMNLCYNAKDAMGKEGGMLKVGLQPVELEGMKTTTGFLSKGQYVELTISDTGEGMSPEVVKNMFDPYYTTKEQGKGTGLGLATVHGIVKSHGGEIEVKSKPGKGSTFRIYFPVTDKEEQAVEYGKEQNAITGQGKLLFVDDEEMIAEAFDELLEASGFDVDTYILPGQALKDFKGNLYDVVLTDFQMPRMDGIEFIREIRKKDKNVKIIICSGNPSSITDKEYKNLDLYAIIQKPFDYIELTQIIQQAVDSK